MIFDERDLDEEISDEDRKKSHKPQQNQLNLDDLMVESKDNKVENLKDKQEKKSKKTAQKKEIESNSLISEVEEQLEENEKIDELCNEESGAKSFEDTLTMDEDGNYLKDISKVYHDSMIPYSEYVILDRAIPRVEDGLKPVQRRILYSMWELGVTPDKPYKKSAKTVGDVIANYHPHGDASIYNAMVHLAQKFSMREILIDGHGNFGSIDGDGPAAMRYTEARLAPLALEILRDIEKDTVRWAKTYDDAKDEPEMLPSRFPNILVNGSTGIAVGLATNIPPHNLGECVDACVSYIDNPKITVDEIMKIIKGPDFPSGGLIIGEDGIKQAYETGKGKIIVRAKTHIEQEKGDKQTIVITEFPYQVNKSQVLLKIAELKEKYKDILSGIADIRDESDRQGIRAVVCLKKDANAEAILNFLLKYTELQTSFGVNMVVIADGKPRQLGLLEILHYYVKYQQQVVLKRTKYDLEDATNRENILEGLLIAIQNIDEVIKIIKKSASTVEAKHSLCKKFNLNERQAQAILDMRLARLTNLEVGKLEQDLLAIKKLIKELTAIVKSPKLQMDIVKKEMLEIKKKFGNKRLTIIVNDATKFNIEDKLDVLKPVKDVFIAVNEKNCIKKMPEKSFMSSAKSATEKSSLNEVHNVIVKTKSDTSLLLLTKMGQVYKLEQDNILEARWKDRGSMLQDLISTYDPNDKVLYVIDYKDKLPNYDLVFITSLGNIKRINVSSEFDVKKQGFPALKLKENEFIVNVSKYEKNKTMLFITSDGMGVNVDINDVPPSSRTTGLLKGVMLNGGECVVGGGLVDEQAIVVISTNAGYVKKILVKEFGVLPRNRKGLKILTLGKDNGMQVVFAEIVKNTFEIIAFDKKGNLYSVSTDDVIVENRTTKGKLINKQAKGVVIKNIYKYLWE